MKLDDFMKAEGLDDAAMAARIGEVSEFAVKKWRYGERMPRPGVMGRITSATHGQVTANDFIEARPSEAA